MYRTENSHRIVSSLAYIFSHSLITLLAIGIAFTLPIVAQYILYQWWPRVEADTHLLFFTEIGFAGVLVVIFNIAMILWDNRRYTNSAKLASLVHARSNDGWLARWRERILVKRLPASRDAFVLTVTGFNTFAGKRSLLRGVLKSAYEIRVMLLNPNGEGARLHVQSLPPKKGNFTAFRDEIESSISYLDALRRAGKKVALKFYDHQPFWKVVVLGEHVWVQYCHSGCEINRAPEYVFALHDRDPKQGFFAPFYMHFLDKWSESEHPEYDFESRELVYRDAAGNEIKRLSLVTHPDAHCAGTNVPQEAWAGWNKIREMKHYESSV